MMKMMKMMIGRRFVDSISVLSTAFCYISENCEVCHLNWLISNKLLHEYCVLYMVQYKRTAHFLTHQPLFILNTNSKCYSTSKYFSFSFQLWACFSISIIAIPMFPFLNFFSHSLMPLNLNASPVHSVPEWLCGLSLLWNSSKIL